MNTLPVLLLMIGSNSYTPEFSSRVNEAVTGLSSINFFPSTIEKTLRQLTPTTSTGHDGIPNILLKHCVRSLAVPLSHPSI